MEKESLKLLLKLFEVLNYHDLILRALFMIVLLPAAIGLLYFSNTLVLICFLGILGYLCLLECLYLCRREKNIINNLFLLFGMVCIVAGSAGIYGLWIRETEFLLVIISILTVAASNIGGYFGANFIGRTKINEKIIGDKTWESLLCGVIFATSSCFLLFYYTRDHSQHIPYDDFFRAAIFGLIVGFISQAGNILLLICKKRAKVKSSNPLIPHQVGGLLDNLAGYLAFGAYITVYNIWWYNYGN